MFGLYDFFFNYKWDIDHGKPYFQSKRKKPRKKVVNKKKGKR